MADNENFFSRVYDVVKQIPYGRVTSYGAVAKYLGFTEKVINILIVNTIR